MLECNDILNIHYQLPTDILNILNEIDVDKLDSTSVPLDPAIRSSKSFKYHTGYKMYDRYYKHMFPMSKTDKPIQKNTHHVNIGAERYKSLLEAVSKTFSTSYVQWANHIIYPAENGFLGWHTNWLTPRLRLYLNYVDEDDKSFIRYIHPKTGEMITSYDKKGWQARTFDITRDETLWHCVRANTRRVSLGFRITKRG